TPTSMLVTLHACHAHRHIHSLPTRRSSDLHERSTLMAQTRSFSVSIALLAAGALFLEILDGTILTTAIPAIASEFGVGAGDVSLVLVAYLVAAAVGIPAAGWLSDRFGVRPVFLLALLVFTVASLICALAPNLGLLIAARV